MGRPKKDITDEERYKTSNEYHTAYGRKPWKCESCDTEITYNAKLKHLTSKKDLKSDFKPWKSDICNVSNCQYMKVIEHIIYRLKNIK